jgi:hypothetical protein
MGGLNFAFPDVCLTPTPVGPIPIPYPNLAMPMTALPPTASLKVLTVVMPTHNLITTVPLSNGDNAGVNMGVASGMVMGPNRHLMGSVKTLIGGSPVTKMLSPTGQNGMSLNIPGISLVPCQVKVMVLS